MYRSKYPIRLDLWCNYRAMMAMNSDQLLGLLGRSATDHEVQAAMAESGITSMPALQKPDSPHDDPDWFDWLLSGRHGIEFGFGDEAYIRARSPKLRGKGPLLLCQLYFYCEHAGIFPYRGDLPFHLCHADDRAEVRRKLVRVEPVRRSYVRDVWNFPDYRMVVAYTFGGRTIASVVCLIPLSPWPAEEMPRLPRVDQVIELFGELWDSPSFRRVFSPLDLEAFGRDIARREVVDLRHAYGFQLYFERTSPTIDGKTPLEGDITFAAIKFHRDRDSDAYGWKGELPFGIQFNDPQDVLFGKVGREPDQMEDHDLEGFALWHFPRFSLHLLYSNFENVLIRATVMQPGFWSSLQV
jgi:hypothetical protein